ncbi:hypothetical protein CAEBREN_10105 [Caenorhabditis brenneri]|uniref:Serpentine receptor class gamma n=1 Tax=Caenorhabditis brenneri TaxID=135651 RepID=G0N0R4_CAEBE|nr:hypothetical protein CAEBREN_10105 [Caenorhabditis brenneri]
MHRMIAYQSIVMVTLTTTSMMSQIFAWFLISHNFIFLQIALFSDVVTKYFSITMLYPLIFNQMLSRLYTDMWVKAFTSRRIVYYMIVCGLVSSIAAGILVITSGIKRYYAKNIGFYDSGIPGYQLNINRFFYIFPAGCLVCYIVLLVHVRRKSHATTPNRFHDNGKQRVFVQLIVTILCYVVMCALFEFLNYQDWSSNTVTKINLVGILNVINYLPEVSLPCLLLLTNKQMRRKISMFLAHRSNNVSVSVVNIP